jgi:hypothetical protein
MKLKTVATLTLWGTAGVALAAAAVAAIRALKARL